MGLSPGERHQVGSTAVRWKVRHGRRRLLLGALAVLWVELVLGWSAMPSANAVAPTGGQRVVEVAAGQYYTCALRSDGSISCWGSNNVGQLGDGTTVDHSQPTPVPGLANVKAVAVGPSHTCAVLADATVTCWGRNTFGELGDGTTVDRHEPTPVPVPSPVEALDLGAHHTCAVLADATVSCWGD